MTESCSCEGFACLATLSIVQEFVIHSDHEALKHLRGQGKMNVVVDALSRKHALIVMLETKLIALDCIKKLYEKDIAFGEFLSCAIACEKTHEGGLVSHFGKLKTFEILNEHFFLSRMRKDVHNVCERCLTCKLTKSKVSPHGLYATLPIPTTPWIDISMNFVLSLPRSKGETQSFLVIFGGPYGIGLVQNYSFPPLVINKRMDKLRKSLRDWEDLMPHVEFAYNRVFNSTISHSLFELAYDFNPLSPT
ncbi:Tf2-11, partial [Mucuna pruriens]